MQTPFSSKQRALPLQRGLFTLPTLSRAAQHAHAHTRLLLAAHGYFEVRLLMFCRLPPAQAHKRRIMVANRLKNLAHATRGAVRGVRRALEELLDGLAMQPKPQLVRVPVRASNGAFRSPFNEALGRRGFSTTSACRAYATNNANFRAFKSSNFFRFVRTRPNLAIKLWPYSAFRAPLPSKGAFPGSLYRNFLNLSVRNFGTTHGGSYSHDAIQNLFTGLRTMVKENELNHVTSREMIRNNARSRSYHGCASQSAANETLQLARCESTNVETTGSYVEFNFPDMSLSIPSVSFMNPEIMSSIEDEFQRVKEQIDATTRNIQLIFDAYGSLPIEKTGTSVRIHFPNLDAEEVEKLLIELSINDGLVYARDELEVAMDASVDGSDLSSTSLSDLLEDRVPGLVSSDSGSSVCDSDYESVDYFPVLSSSGNSHSYVTPIDISISSSPVIIADAASFSYSGASI